MRALNWVVGAALLLGIGVARAGLPLITIDPNNYSAGQIITDPSGEGQFNALSAYSNPDPNAPFQQEYLLQTSPVFASLAPLSCNAYLGGPCAPSGNKLFGWSPVGDAGHWGDAANAVECVSLNDCDTKGASAFVFPVLEITFTRPTDFVDAEIGFINDPDGGWIEAFNSAGQSLGSCDARPGEIFPAGSCGSYPDPSDPAWAQYSVTDSNRDISYVLIGGESNSRSVGQVQYSTPEPGSFGLLALGVGAIGFLRLRRRVRSLQ